MTPDAREAGASARPLRDVTSFVRRGDRLSPSRQAAWDRSAARYVLDLPRGDRDTLPAPGTTLDLERELGRRAPLTVEIGSGQGENVAAAAADHPERDFLAVEVYVPGIAQTLLRIERAGSPGNLRILPLDALRSLPQLLPARSIDELWVFYPDPWHKSRHHKRRLINPPFVAAMLPLLADRAVLRLATDWAQYAGHMRAVLDACDELEPLVPAGPRPPGTPSDPLPEGLPELGWAPRFAGRVRTSFEDKGIRAGRISWDLAYLRAPR